MRETGGVAGKTSIATRSKRICATWIFRRDRRSSHEGGKHWRLRGQYLVGLANCLEIMWDLAMEILGKGPAVPYARCVEASTGRAPEPSKPEAKRERVAELLNRAGYSTSDNGGLLGAVDAWRRERIAPMGSVKALGAAVIAYFDNLSAAQSAAVPAEGTRAACRAPTSNSCPSKTPGSPAR